jgi:uncharacterized protein (DUF4213/DUF364 family)
LFKGGDVSKISGAQYIAETFKGYGVTHVFYMEIILPQSLIEMEMLSWPIRP